MFEYKQPHYLLCYCIQIIYQFDNMVIT